MISNYGVENILLDYAQLNKYSSFLPLIGGYDHGWSMREFNGISTTLRRKIQTHFVWNKRTYDNLSKYKQKKPYITSSFYKLYKEKYNILKNPKKGSIFFLAHSTNKIRANQDIYSICKILENLPHSFQPVDICMTIYDKNNNKHYSLKNFNLVTAGSTYSNDYVKNFYELIKNYKYGFSNQPGTYLLNCVDLGIPFSLIGDEPSHLNYGDDPNVPYKYKISDFEFGKYVYKLFNGIHYEITKEQKILVENEMGYKDKISSEDMRKIIFNDLKNVLKNKEYFQRFTIEFLKRPYSLFYNYDK